LEEPTGTREETVGSRIAARYDNPEERFARREIGKRMADSIRQLAPELRHVCLLRDVLEYSTQEVAQRLGVSSLTVRLRLFRARRRLRENLSLGPIRRFPLASKSRSGLQLHQCEIDNLHRPAFRGVESCDRPPWQGYGTRPAAHTPLYLQRLDRNARRRFAGQEDRACGRTQPERVLRQHRESVSRGGFANGEGLHGDGLL